MNQKRLHSIKQLLKGNKLTAEEIEDLLLTIEDEIYDQQIKDFKQHLEDSMPREHQGEEGMTAFYDLQWQISFNGKTLTVHNEALVYNCMLDFVKDYADEYLS